MSLFSSNRLPTKGNKGLVVSKHLKNINNMKQNKGIDLQFELRASQGLKGTREHDHLLLGNKGYLEITFREQGNC